MWLQGSAIVQPTFSGKCWRVFRTSSHCKETIVCSWMDQIQPWFRRSFYFSMPNPMLTLIPQVVSCLCFDPGQPCLMLVPWSLSLRYTYVIVYNRILVLLGWYTENFLNFFLSSLMYFFTRHGDVSYNDYFFRIVVVQSYAGAAFPDMLSPESQKFLSLSHLSLEIPTWVKATDPRQTDRQRGTGSICKATGPAMKQALFRGTVERGAQFKPGGRWCYRLCH